MSEEDEQAITSNNQAISDLADKGSKYLGVSAFGVVLMAGLTGAGGALLVPVKNKDEDCVM